MSWSEGKRRDLQRFEDLNWIIDEFGYKHYMHLAKMDGKWMIINVLWQSHPPKK